MSYLFTALAGFRTQWPEIRGGTLVVPHYIKKWVEILLVGAEKDPDLIKQRCILAYWLISLSVQSGLGNSSTRLQIRKSAALQYVSRQYYFNNAMAL